MKKKTLEELKKNIGKTGYVMFKNLRFEVKILEVSRPYGNTTYVVSPIAGEGFDKFYTSNVVVK